MLNAHNIEFKQIKHTDPEFQNYPDLVEDVKSYSVAALKRKKWIIMGSRDFKEMVMCLRTKKASEIRRYYLAIEDLFKMYCEYTLHFQLRREKRRLGKKQGTIDDLVRGMGEMKLERREAEQKAEQRYNNLMARCDQLLHHAEQAEDDLQAIASNLEEVRNVAVPKPKQDKNLHKIGVVRKSSHYERATSDPTYYARADVVVIRRQRGTFNQRVKEIRNYGAGTNLDAELIVDKDSPNSINLFNRLKEDEGSPFIFHGPCGVEFTEEGTEDRLREEVDRIHGDRMQLP